MHEEIYTEAILNTHTHTWSVKTERNAHFF